ALNGCIVIEEDPFVTLTPEVILQSHVRGNAVYVTATINANPDYVTLGNIPTVLSYEGEVELYNEATGALLDAMPIEGSGPSAVVEVSASAANLRDMVIIVSGRVQARADKGNDGDPDNDYLLEKAEFYQMRLLSEVISMQDYPVVTMAPTVEPQSHFRGTELYTTAIIAANPTYLNTGIDPILFGYSGVMQIYDRASGALLKSTAIAGSGLSTSVTILVNTAIISGRLVIITSGTVTCTADIDADGNASNDIVISTATFYSTEEVSVSK
ncbi:MAG: hypothetical protein LC655_03575, partial [Bacteroidales bacterium]|nr:hypothetical protein [Bacteroidales bacterium]